MQVATPYKVIRAKILLPMAYQSQTRRMIGTKSGKLTSNHYHRVIVWSYNLFLQSLA